MQLLNSLPDLEKAHTELAARQSAANEWFLTSGGQRPLPLNHDEMEFRRQHGRLYFACWGRDGAQLWQVMGYRLEGRDIILEAARRLGARRETLTLRPRATVQEMNLELSAARLELCARLGQLAQAYEKGAVLEQCKLSAGATPCEAGPYARLILRRHQRRIYATAPVVPWEAGRLDAFLVAAWLWFRRRAGEAVHFWLIVPEAAANIATERLALLSTGWRQLITLLTHDAAWQTLRPVSAPTLAEILAREVKPVKLPVTPGTSEGAGAWAARHEPAVDVVRARHGATWRWHGLPFARVRRLAGTERVWFGLESKGRQILTEQTWGEWERLIRELETHRRATAPDRRHALYRARSEAWLETLLRQDINRLDPGLIIAPLHAQFRVATGAARPIDLLALRQDGRLVVVELKTTADCQHALQGADYWLRVEQQRRGGHLAARRLFGAQEIADEPALVYLVAPLLSFHRDGEALAQMLHPAIEIFRFDLNEDWRAGVRVARRQAMR
jgi:hypothetical protein